MDAAPHPAGPVPEHHRGRYRAIPRRADSGHRLSIWSQFGQTDLSFCGCPEVACGSPRTDMAGSSLLPTTLVGSYPQPDWLIDRASLAKQMPPRVRARELWRVPPERLEEAQDDATLLAIADQERAGLDIVTDGEQRRESYSNRFATALDGIDIDNPGRTPNRTGGFTIVPRVVGKIRRKHPVEVRDVQFLSANTDRTIKMTVPGPFTLAQQCEDQHYGDEAALALDYAAAVNAEIKDLFAAGA